MMRQLVIQLARFGDLLQTGRLVRSLQNTGETHLCVDQSLASLAHLVYPGCIIHGIVAHADARKLDSALFSEIVCKNRKVFAELVDLHADAVYNLNHSPLNFALASLFPASNVHGYAVENGQVLRDRWMRFALRWTSERRISPVNLVDFWAMLARHPALPQDFNPPAKPGGRGLGVVLAGRQERRSLPPDVLALMITSLCEGLGGVPVFLTGGREDRQTGRKVMENLPQHILARTTNCAGRTDWTELQNILRGLDLLLSPDTGTMHFAAHLGVPVFGIFLSSAWAWETGAYGSGHRIWQAIPDCAPCRESAQCPHQRACLDVFRSPAFLRALFQEARCIKNAEHPSAAPEGILCLDSGFDDLGLIWIPRNAEHDVRTAARLAGEADRRSMLRLLLTDYLASQGKFDHSITDDPISVPCAETFYLEADWMLPERIA